MLPSPNDQTKLYCDPVGCTFEKVKRYGLLFNKIELGTNEVLKLFGVTVTIISLDAACGAQFKLLLNKQFTVSLLLKLLVLKKLPMAVGFPFTYH